jgi:hypothetical protein
MILEYLREHGETSSVVLTNELGLNSGSTSIFTRQLEADGAVSCRKEGRQKHWRLTGDVVPPGGHEERSNGTGANGSGPDGFVSVHDIRARVLELLEDGPKTSVELGRALEHNERLPAAMELLLRSGDVEQTHQGTTRTYFVSEAE